mmetsp:Transcript_29753/g.66740  ORF Transcript_29753/g.66740 Transcript_29753/m.66740 type:complete len:239 (+) Transcript_29753:417-1133(+)
MLSPRSPDYQRTLSRRSAHAQTHACAHTQRKHGRQTRCVKQKKAPPPFSLNRPGTRITCRGCLSAGGPWSALSACFAATSFGIAWRRGSLPLQRAWPHQPGHRQARHRQAGLKWRSPQPWLAHWLARSTASGAPLASRRFTSRASHPGWCRAGAWPQRWRPRAPCPASSPPAWWRGVGLWRTALSAIRPASSASPPSRPAKRAESCTWDFRARFLAGRAVSFLLASGQQRRPPTSLLT